jgi:hypothetical protein
MPPEETCSLLLTHEIGEVTLSGLSRGRGAISRRWRFPNTSSKTCKRASRQCSMLVGERGRVLALDHRLSRLRGCLSGTPLTWVLNAEHARRPS